MLIRVSDHIRGDHAELRALVRDAFEGVDPRGVEIHIEPARHSGESFTGLAYFSLPSRSRLEPGTEYLVRLRLPRALRNRAYPRTYRYPRLKTAPWITVRDWRERLVALAAHEACHVRQFREGIRRSEVQAERWALRLLHEWRASTVPRPRTRRRRSSLQVGPAGEGLEAQLALF
ncbi:MAG TPA: hypothetical protein VKA30_06710 [Actinomycetota bacterium]|nr:hypothetical protein [Actinomycetota bacterium]